MGSESDLPVMEDAIETLDDFNVPYEARVLSAHRTPQRMQEYAESAEERGLKVIIAGAGGAAHLPGMIAASTTLPVLGVPVGSLAINGAENAALLAVQILATSDEQLQERLHDYKQNLIEKVEQMDERVQRQAGSLHDPG